MHFEKLSLLWISIFCCLLTDSTKSQTLEVVNDNQLLELFRTENHVVVLFSMYFWFIIIC